MFARTERLMLRPAWPEDAAVLAAAIGHERVAMMLERVPHPYTLRDAKDWVSAPRGAEEPRFVIERMDGDHPVLIGGIALLGDRTIPRLGYWLTPSAWGCGYATEAGRAVIDIARHALPVGRLAARHFADNPASGRVLRKLGFRPSGIMGEMRSAARATPAAAVEYTLDLEIDRSAMPIAA